MILIALIGYVLVYAIVLMMVITFVCAVALSFAVYVVSYYVLYAWAAIRNRSRPEWMFERKNLPIDMDKIQGFATSAGISAMLLMTLGFFIYALSGSWAATLWVPGVLGTVALFVVWDTERSKDVSDRRTFGDIQDRKKREVI